MRTREDRLGDAAGSLEAIDSWIADTEAKPGLGAAALLGTLRADRERALHELTEALMTRHDTPRRKATRLVAKYVIGATLDGHAVCLCTADGGCVSWDVLRAMFDEARALGLVARPIHVYGRTCTVSWPHLHPQPAIFYQRGSEW